MCRWGAAVLLLLCCLAGEVPAQTLTAGPLAAHPDLRLTMLARQALLTDREVAALNLGIKVEKRVAYLWGGVPSETVRVRAERLIQRLPDILEVRSSLHLEEVDPVPGPGFLPPVPSPSRKETRVVPTLPMNTWRPGTPAGSFPSEQAVRFRPAVPMPLTPATEGEVVQLPTILLPATPSSTALFTPMPAQVQVSIDQLRQRERFRLLHADLKGGRVYLSGEVFHWEDMQDFAREVSRLPGVDGVVLGRVTLVGSGRK